MAALFLIETIHVHFTDYDMEDKREEINHFWLVLQLVKKNVKQLSRS
jgi:hypothetical protein